MKKIVLSISALCLLASCQQKIAFVDNSKLINQYQEKIDLENHLKEKISKYERKRDSISQAFQSEAQSFQLEAAKLGQAAAQKKYNELMQKSQTLQQSLMQEEQDIRQESETKMDSLLSKVKKFVKTYGEKNNYTFILGENDGGSVLYGSPSQDITEKIVKELNENFKK